MAATPHFKFNAFHSLIKLAADNTHYSSQLPHSPGGSHNKCDVSACPCTALLTLRDNTEIPSQENMLLHAKQVASGTAPTAQKVSQLSSGDIVQSRLSAGEEYKRASSLQTGASISIGRTTFGLVAEVHNKSTILLTSDVSQSVLSALDETGLHAMQYLPWGYIPGSKLRTVSGFNGELMESSQGDFIRLGKGVRDYDLVLMRFRAPDELSPFGEGGLNAYAYCGNDPINNLDPSGQAWGMIARVMKALAGVSKLPKSRIKTPALLPGTAGSNVVRASSSVNNMMNKSSRMSNPAGKAVNSASTSKPSSRNFRPVMNSELSGVKLPTKQTRPPPNQRILEFTEHEKDLLHSMNRGPVNVGRVPSKDKDRMISMNTMFRGPEFTPLKLNYAPFRKLPKEIFYQEHWKMIHNYRVYKKQGVRWHTDRARGEPAAP